MSITLRRRCWCGCKTASRAFRLRLSDGLALRYYRCDRCRVLVQYPRLDNETLARYYAAGYYGATRKKFVPPISTMVQWFQNRRTKWIADRLPKGGRVLDVGCGNGQLLINLKEAGLAAEGTEWTAESAARVPVETAIPVHIGDLLTVDLQPARYDGIVIWHVLEHVRDPDRTIAKAAELLRPGGWIFLAFPNQDSLQARLFGRAWFHLDPPRHLYGFTERSARELLTRHGFTMEQKSTWSLEQNPYGILQSMLNATGIFDREQAYETLKGTSAAGAASKSIDLLLLAILTPLAILLSLVETMLGKGGTLMIVARRDEAG